jgi:hypothetical protein
VWLCDGCRIAWCKRFDAGELSIPLEALPLLQIPPLRSTLTLQLNRMATILAALFDDLFVYTLSFLSSIEITNFTQLTSKSISERATPRKIAKWVITQGRLTQLQALREVGEIPFAMLEDTASQSHTLEKLYFFEHPPRFPVCFFEFGDTALPPIALDELKYVAELLARHRTLVIRVEGRCQPDAPGFLKYALSSQRALCAAEAIRDLLFGIVPGEEEISTTICGEDVNYEASGINDDALRASHRIEFEGLSSSPLINQNFKNLGNGAAAVSKVAMQPTEQTIEAYDEWAESWRRVDLTVLRM